ncbi:ABC transporter permease [Paralysiella testudinis]|jgi:putative spermidine/putrescine transport system permease protein|uniref:ABC transporter permease n=1 Tax=Paralysiella testudinis TaxID=2809020 RepID=UPI001E503629|nr:ABC transporter permease [Paralysiella testudinis]
MMLARLIKIGFGTLAVLFLVAPLFAILPLAFTSSVFLTYPIPDWSTRWFQELATADAWRRSIINSLMIGGGTTLLATILGTMAALGLRQQGMRFAAPLRTLFILPMVVPAVVLGVGMQLLFAQLGLANTYLGVIVAHSIVAIPLVFITVSGAVAGLDKRVELAAESLGASPFTVLRKITLPLAAPGIVSGAVLAFATSLDEVVLTLFVAGPNQRTLARQMFSTIRENISPAIAAAALIFIVGTIVLGVVTTLLRRRMKKAVV